LLPVYQQPMQPSKEVLMHMHTYIQSHVYLKYKLTKINRKQNKKKKTSKPLF